MNFKDFKRLTLKHLKQIIITLLIIIAFIFLIIKYFKDIHGVNVGFTKEDSVELSDTNE